MVEARRPRHIIVFARTPEFGRVKTRLARDIGSLSAWRFYRNTLGRTLREAGKCPGAQIWIAQTGAQRRFGHLGASVFRQTGRHLAERMENALRRLPPGDVILVGGDIPGLRRIHLERAFDCLRCSPIVFGPAVDGGFWLVGLRRTRIPQRPLFGRDVRWSSEHALRDVLAGLPIQAALADTLHDVDDGAAFHAHRRRGTDA